MILCVCRGISDRHVVEAIQRGARTVDDITRSCPGAGAQCGSCRRDLEALLTAGDHSARS